MKKKIQINPVPDEVYEMLHDEPISIFGVLEEMSIDIPNNSEFVLLCIKLTQPKVDIRFYNNQDSYLMNYTKCILRDLDNYDFYSFSRDDMESPWGMFFPPPVVSVGLSTRLRPSFSQN